MDTPDTITIQLDDREYEHLEAAARRKGMAPDVLVRSLVDDALKENILNDPEPRKQAMHDARDGLDKLTEMRHSLPEVDAVQIVREGRDEFDRRSIF